MAIIKRSTAPAPTFENDPDGGSDTAVLENPAEQAAAPAAAAAPAKPVVAVAVVKPTALAVSTGRMQDVVQSLKNNIQVDFNTLDRIQVLAGNFVLQDSSKLPLGNTIEFELMSYQDNFVISPGEDGAEAAAAVRYSNDGVTLSDGGDCQEYLATLRDVYPDAQMKQRCVLVMELLAAPAAKNQAAISEYMGKLFQMDLAPTSKKKFDSYKIQASFDVSKGRIGEADARKVVSTIEGASAVGRDGKKMDWSVARFAVKPSVSA